MKFQCINQDNLVEFHSEINRCGENQFFNEGIITYKESGFEFFPNTFHGSRHYKNFKDVLLNIKRENETFGGSKSWKVSTDVLNKVNVSENLNEFNCYQIKNVCGMVKMLEDVDLPQEEDLKIIEARSYSDIKIWSRFNLQGDIYSFLEMSTNLNVKMITCISDGREVATAIGFVSKDNIGIYQINVLDDLDKNYFSQVLIKNLWIMGKKMGCKSSSLQCNYSEIEFFKELGYRKENCYGVIKI